MPGTVVGRLHRRAIDHSDSGVISSIASNATNLDDPSAATLSERTVVAQSDRGPGDPAGGVNVEVSAGDLIMVTGPSGVGKSTVTQRLHQRLGGDWLLCNQIPVNPSTSPCQRL